MINEEYVNFYSATETDMASYRNRISNLDNYDDYIYNKILFKNGSIPADDLRKFLRLKIKDATENKDSNTVAKSTLASSTVELLDNDSLLRSMDALKVANYVQLFLDNYMSPLNSDIRYRLGEVTATKVFQCDPKNRSIIYDDDKNHLDMLAQYDEFGRIDTSSNFRCVTHIEGTSSNIIPPYDEYYVNWFFPPFDNKCFKKENDATDDLLADFGIKNRVWDGTKWNYYNENSEKVTFDKEDILSLRDKPTYRGIAFKPLNDNISFLQQIFEQCTGIVSTYLTEWDLSIYIQEGLLSRKYSNRNSLISLNNRIVYDNPVGYKDESALSFGVLNSAVSKTPMGEGLISNTAPYVPYAYPLSIYWWPYKSMNRGDGLDRFYNTALKGFDPTYFDRANLKNKLKWYDEVGAAYSGWYNWNNIRNYQTLYTNKDDGFSPIDLIHLNECMEDFKFESDAVKGTKGEIEQIIESLYSEDGELGFPEEEWDETRDWKDGKDYYRLSKHFKTDKKTGNAVFMYAVKSCITDTNKDSIYYKSEDDLEANIGVSSKEISNSVDIGIEGDIRILGIRIPGSGLLRTFLKRSSINDRVLALSEKAKNGYSSSTSASRKGKSKKGDDKKRKDNSGMELTDNTDLSEELASMLGTDDQEPSRYARQDGLSQWSPMLYGGPHGAYASPKTIQGYFEVDNPFLRNIPRLTVTKSSNGRFIKDNDFYVDDKSEFFKGSEANYNLYKNDAESIYKKIDFTSRSPSRCMNLLNKGYFDYTMYPVECYRKNHVSIEVEGTYDDYGNFQRYNRPDYYKGHKLYYESNYFYYGKIEKNTHYVTPNPFVIKTRRNWFFMYSREIAYEWDTYYQYEKANECYFKDALYYGGRYLLKKSVYVRYYPAYYYEWVTINYKRPLLHSNPNEYWSMSRINKYNISTTRVQNFWRSRWLNFCSLWSGARYMISSYLVYTLNPPEEVFRLTFPKSSIAIYRDSPQMNGRNYPYIISNAERDFMENVLNNTENKEHTVLFFASKNNESYRDTYGPDLIFSAKCHIETYTYKYRVQKWYKYRHRCHYDWDWYWSERVAKGSYICVDVPTSNKNSIALSGFKPDVGLPASNLGVTKTLSSTDNYMDRDVPPENSKTTLYTTPISFESIIPWKDHISFGGKPRNYGYEYGFHGWGYTTALPGLQPRFEYDKGNSFEDPNDYLNIRHRYSYWDLKYGLRNYSFNSLISDKFFPFYHLSDDAPCVYPTGKRDDNIVFTRGVRRYVQWESSPKLKGLMVALRNCFTTSTFFKSYDSEILPSTKPCIVTNDCMLRTAVRAALHQKSYLKKARDILENNIDFDSVKNIIEKRIDNEILDKTIYPETKDTQSVFYHYWIDKAYEVFSNPNNKKIFLDKFDKKIEYLNTFIKNSNSLVGKSIGMWSYNDFVRSLDNLSILQDNFLNYNREDISTKGATVDDFMYMYLSILYEYRKYFVNKRCNKVDGTLWILRSLESAMPMVSEPEGPHSGGGLDTNPNTSGLGHNFRYKVDFYRTTKTALDKVSAAYNKEILEAPRTKAIFIKVRYVSSTVADKYLKGIKDGTWNESERGRLVYIKKNQRWAELPFDEEYRYVSREYARAKADLVYNEKAMKIAEKNNSKPNLREINPKIDGISNNRCVFKIKWTLTGGLNVFYEKYNNGFRYFNPNDKSKFSKEYIEGYKSLTLSNFLDMSNNFPYTYEGDADKLPSTNEENSIPSILFDVNSGIDLNKVEELAKSGNKTFDNAQNTLCSIRETTDYWSILIPDNARPLTEGYKKGLCIKTEISRETLGGEDSFPNGVTTTMGSFGYALYPITEEQANVLPGIGTNMEEVSLKLRDKILD